MILNEINSEEERNLVMDRLRFIFDQRKGNANYKEAEELMNLLEKYDENKSSFSDFVNN